MGFKDPAAAKAYYKAWREANKETLKAKKKAWRDRVGYCTDSDLAYRARNKEKLVAYVKNWQKQNRHRLKAIGAKRRAAKLQRTPPWLTNEERSKIAEFYAHCPPGYEVDHIIPLQGKEVSGLHILINLQYLPVVENRKKSNKFASPTRSW